MSKVEEIKRKLANLEKLEEKQDEEKQRLYEELEKAEQKEKEGRFVGKPQLYLYDGGYDGMYYIAATTKKEAIGILKKRFRKYNYWPEGIEDRIEAIGRQFLHIECTETR